MSLLVLHLLGLAALVGGLLAQAPVETKSVTSTVRNGAALVFITGLGLVGVLQADDVDVDNAKIAVKVGVALVIVVLAVGNRNRERIATGLWMAMLMLAIANMGVAVFWSPVHGAN